MIILSSADCVFIKISIWHVGAYCILFYWQNHVRKLNSNDFIDKITILICWWSGFVERIVPHKSSRLSDIRMVNKSTHTIKYEKKRIPIKWHRLKKIAKTLIFFRGLFEKCGFLWRVLTWGSFKKEYVSIHFLWMQFSSYHTRKMLKCFVLWCTSYMLHYVW